MRVAGRMLQQLHLLIQVLPGGTKGMTMRQQTSTSAYSLLFQGSQERIMFGGRLNMVRGSQQNRSRNRSALIFLLMVAMLVGAELLDEIYITKIQPTKVDMFPLWLRNWDLAGFTLLNEQLPWHFLDPVMLVITHMGSTVFWLFVSVLLWAGNRRRESVLLAVGIVIGGLIFLPVKVAFPRPRPSLVVQGARALDIEGGGSFPSGHSKNGFTACVILGSRWKSLRLPLWFLACLIAVSRIYVGVHWPFDVIIGSIVGWVVGKLTIRYETKIVNAINRISGVVI